jgi:hypothetical protein
LAAKFLNRQLHSSSTTSILRRKRAFAQGAPQYTISFTSRSAFWVNQVEVWFSILQGQSLGGNSFTSLKQLEQHIDANMNAYNDKAEPFLAAPIHVCVARYENKSKADTVIGKHAPTHFSQRIFQPIRAALAAC